MKHLTRSLPLAAFLAAAGICGLARAESVDEHYTFFTLAGPAEAGAGSRDGSNTLARFNLPSGVTVDTAGNVYVADNQNSVLRKILPDGRVRTLAGLGNSTGSSDGSGAGARFDHPQKSALDSAGNLYVVDTYNQILRKITPAGVVTTLAGGVGVAGTNDGPGTEARFNYPQGVAVDGNGTIFVADTSNHTIRKVTPAGVVSTLAGQAGLLGTNNGTGTAAKFNFPYGVAADRASGVLYVADCYNHVIRKIATNGAVTTLAGKMSYSGSANGSGGTARFAYPVGVAVGAGGTVYVADYANNLVRKITPAGVVSTLAGGAGLSGSTDGKGTVARFLHPFDVTADSVSGMVYVADSGNNLIRKITSAGVVSTLAGQVPPTVGSADGTGSAARFSYPSGAVVDGNGNVYITDFGNQVVRKITPAGVVTTLAGKAGTAGTNNGTGSAARFNGPVSVVLDGAGNLLVTEYQNHDIRKITPAGVVTTFVGRAGTGGTNDGTGAAARFQNPIGLAIDAAGNLYVGDTWNHAIRKVTPAGVVTTLAGVKGTQGTNDTGTNTLAQFSFPEGIAVDRSNNVFVVDDGNHAIRRITPEGVVTTLAGLKGTTGSADGTNTQARFYNPLGIACAADGTLFVTDTGNNLIRKITPEGVVTTIGGLAGTSGTDDGTGRDARFNTPEGIALDAHGFLYITDADNFTIRKGHPALPDRPVVDFPTASIGTLRHLDVTNLTTTTWSWSILHYPAAGSAQLSSTTVRNPTFNPDALDDYYVLRFQGWDGQGRMAIGTVTVGDDLPPQVVISSPAWDAQLTNADCTVTGTATDDGTLTGVWVQLNNGLWLPAQGTANWSNQVSLVQGVNTLRAYAKDDQGQYSTTNSVSFVHGVPISVKLDGLGTVSPNYDGKLLINGQTYSMTAQAGVGTEFVNWTGSQTTTAATVTFVMEPNLAFTAHFLDVSNPVVAITAPVASQRVSNSVYTVKGTAGDNVQVSNVWCQINSGDWIQANGTYNWSTNLTFPAGTNTVRAYALDSSGRSSTTNSVTFVCVPHDTLKVQIVGNGSISPKNYTNVLLQLGKIYTVTASPANGMVFSNWSGTVSAITPALTFTMQTGMVLKATFMANPFPTAKGNFAGLFVKEQPDTNAGGFTATLTDKGSLSGKLSFSSTSYSLSGSLSGGGLYSNAIPRKGLSPLIVQFQLDMVGKELITGQVTDGVWTFPIEAHRSVYSKSSPAPVGGKKYTLAIMGGTNAATQPAGYGYGTVSVDAAGAITFSGTLGDGTKVTQSSFVSRDGRWPLFLAPTTYSGKGGMMGWLTFVNETNRDLEGQVSWFRLPQSTSKVYPAGFGFPDWLDVVGSVYSYTNGVPVVNWTSGALELEGGNLAQPFINSAALSQNKITGTNKLSLTITTTSGLFSGSVTGPTGKSITLNGVILQKLNTGYGTFLGTTQTGNILLRSE